MIKSAIVLLLIFFYGCENSKNTQDQCIAAINAYNKKNLNDPKSYESIEYSKVDTIYRIAQAKMDSFDYVTRQINSLDSLQDVIDDIMISGGIRINHHVYDSISDFMRKSADNCLKSKEYKHYKMSNKYRAKNGFDAFVVNTVKYILDTNFVVVSAY